MSTIESAINKSQDLNDNDQQKAKSDRSNRAAQETQANLGRTPGRNQFSPTERVKVANMSQGKLFSMAELVEKHLIFAGMSDAALLNKYRNLRTKLLARASKDNFVTLVTSVVPGGGNSLVSANLAATFAFDESKTAMLIEANLTNPTLNKLLEVNAEEGLIDYLQDEDDEDVSKVIFETPIERLRFIPSGLISENSSEYLQSDRMRVFLKQIVSRYPNRYPIIDAPSITTSADTQILVDICDQVVLVIPYGMCTEDEIKYAATAIGRDKLAGVILNEF